MSNNEAPIEQVYNYPIYMQSVRNGQIIRFESLTTGVVVQEALAPVSLGMAYPKLGEHVDHLYEHSNKKRWVPVDFKETGE
jgi:hypothetical protein